MKKIWYNNHSVAYHIVIKLYNKLDFGIKVSIIIGIMNNATRVGKSVIAMITDVIIMVYWIGVITVKNI